ncbi:MAG: helix-turn-helix transcriptional regulator [Solirubrobacteraceae bacterium]
MTRRTVDQIANELRTFGRNLHAAHEAFGVNQAGFPAISGFDHAMINLIESGKRAPRFETLLKLARAARVRPADLLDGIGHFPQPLQMPEGHELDETAGARFGFNLKWARKRADMTHAQLWSAANVDRSLISDWEKGKREPNLRTILKLARALALPPAVLLHGVEFEMDSDRYPEHAAPSPDVQ